MGRAPRSLKVHPQRIDRVKQSVLMNGFFSQKDLQETLSMTKDAVNGFLNGHPVEPATAIEICRELNLELDEYCVPGNWSMENEVQTAPGPLATVPPVIDAEYADVKEPETQAEARPKDTIHQKIGTLKGLAAGDVGEFNRQSGAGATGTDSSDESEEAPPLSDEQQLNDLNLHQDVDVVEEPGILLGRVRGRLNDNR